MAKSKPPRLWLARDHDGDYSYVLLSGRREDIYCYDGHWCAVGEAVILESFHNERFEEACPHLTLDPGEIRELNPLTFKGAKR